ncbi:hypothetical protein PIB30_086966, partial [Stylosanthes scabra]|nr:hypothetical protein [Stylosanthes scabra]
LAGFSCIIRDSSGHLIKGCSGAIPFDSILRCDELFAILRRLILAWECGCKDALCEIDCLEAFLLITQDYNNPNQDHFDLIAKIKEVLLWNWTVSISLVQRTANKATDHMAKNSAKHQHIYTE